MRRAGRPPRSGGPAPRPAADTQAAAEADCYRALLARVLPALDAAVTGGDPDDAVPDPTALVGELRRVLAAPDGDDADGPDAGLHAGAALPGGSRLPLGLTRPTGRASAGRDCRPAPCGSPAPRRW